jgi:hypothetical protein
LIAKTLNQLCLTHAQELSIPKQAFNKTVLVHRTNPLTEPMSRICSRNIIKHHHGLGHTTLTPNLKNYSHILGVYIMNMNLNIWKSEIKVKKELRNSQ